MTLLEMTWGTFARNLLGLGLILWLAGAGGLWAAESNPLQPADTSSPRATLQSFLEMARQAYDKRMALRQGYLESGRLYATEEEENQVRDLTYSWETIAECMDLSAVSYTLKYRTGLESSMQLFNVLDRIALPEMDTIPDLKEIQDAEFKQWTIPGTRIRIAQVKEGHATGQYLFSPNTLERIPEFYEKVQHLPSLSGRTNDIYQIHVSGAVGMRAIIPVRWIFKMPDWTLRLVFGQPVWKHIFTLVVFGLCALVIMVVGKLVHKMKDKNRESLSMYSWSRLVLPVLILALIPIVNQLLDNVIGLSGEFLNILDTSLGAAFFITGSWTIWLGGRVLAETIISSQHLRRRSLDSQLIRLGLRLVALIFAIALLVEGANRSGLPAYSILAGLGVGGLAVALAAKDTLANLLGSLVIMIEKPFRMNHWIKVGEHEGIVEGVGFRSTRLRTFYNSMIVIPNNEVINARLDNMGMRQFRRVKTTLQITYDTPPEKIEAFLEGIKNIIQANSKTRKDYFHVTLNNFGEHCLEILVYFFLRVPDWSAELVERQRVFIEIIRLAASMGVEFAFPTETLYLKNLKAGKATEDPAHPDAPTKTLKDIANPMDLRVRKHAHRV